MLEKTISAILLSAVILSLTAVIYLTVSPPPTEGFTEFYVLGPGGKAADYPRHLDAGENATVIIGVENHEHAQVDYILKVLLGNVTLQEKNIRLDDNSNWTENYSFTTVGSGEKNLSFILYLRGDDEPYRTLHLNIEVKGG